jgi:hypothetical protein
VYDQEKMNRIELKLSVNAGAINTQNSILQRGLLGRAASGDK